MTVPTVVSALEAATRQQRNAQITNILRHRQEPHLIPRPHTGLGTRLIWFWCRWSWWMGVCNVSAAMKELMKGWCGVHVCTRYTIFTKVPCVYQASMNHVVNCMSKPTNKAFSFFCKRETDHNWGRGVQSVQLLIASIKQEKVIEWQGTMPTEQV